MHSPRKIASEQELYAAALGALARRAHSVFEMRTYLERKAAEAEPARQVLVRLREKKLLDDGRYALEFARLRAKIRGQGRYRIARELRARGVADQHIDAAVEQVFAENDETAMVRKAIAQRMRSLRGPLDSRRMASWYRSLLRGGFDVGLIRRELETAVRAAASDAELPAVDESDEAG